MGMVKIRYWRGYATSFVIFGATRITFYGHLDETELLNDDGTTYEHEFDGDFTLIYGRLKYQVFGQYNTPLILGDKGSEEDPLEVSIELIPSGRNVAFSPQDFARGANDLSFSDDPSYNEYFREANKAIHKTIRDLVEDEDFKESLVNFEGLSKEERDKIVVVGSDEPVGFYIPFYFQDFNHVLLYSDTDTVVWSVDSFDSFKNLFRNPTFLQFPAFEGETIKIPLRQVHRYIGGSFGGFSQFNNHTIAYAEKPLEEFEAKFKDSFIRTFRYKTTHTYHREEGAFVRPITRVTEGSGNMTFKIPGIIEGYSVGKVVFSIDDASGIREDQKGKMEVVIPAGLYPRITGFPGFKRVRVEKEMRIPFVPVDPDRRNLAEKDRNIGKYLIIDNGVNVREFDKFFRRLDFFLDKQPEKAIITREGDLPFPEIFGNIFHKLVVKRR